MQHMEELKVLEYRDQDACMAETFFLFDPFFRFSSSFFRFFPFFRSLPFFPLFFPYLFFFTLFPFFHSTSPLCPLFFVFSFFLPPLCYLFSTFVEFFPFFSSLFFPFFFYHFSFFFHILKFLFFFLVLFFFFLRSSLSLPSSFPFFCFSFLWYFFRYTLESTLHFAPILSTHFPVFEPHIQEWVIFVRRRPLTFQHVSQSLQSVFVREASPGEGLTFPNVKNYEKQKQKSPCVREGVAGGRRATPSQEHGLCPPLVSAERPAAGPKVGSGVQVFWVFRCSGLGFYGVRV